MDGECDHRTDAEIFEDAVKMRSVIDGGAAKSYTALRSRVAELEAAIREHREEHWRFAKNMPHSADAALYAVLRKEVTDGTNTRRR